MKSSANAKTRCGKKTGLANEARIKQEANMWKVTEEGNNDRNLS